MEYTCKNCGAVADEPGHLCNPCGDKANCSFCGTPEVERPSLQAISYQLIGYLENRPLYWI